MPNPSRGSGALRAETAAAGCAWTPEPRLLGQRSLLKSAAPAALPGTAAQHDVRALIALAQARPRHRGRHGMGVDQRTLPAGGGLLDQGQRTIRGRQQFPTPLLGRRTGQPRRWRRPRGIMPRPAATRVVRWFSGLAAEGPSNMPGSSSYGARGWHIDIGAREARGEEGDAEVGRGGKQIVDEGIFGAAPCCQGHRRLRH